MHYDFEQYFSQILSSMEHADYIRSDEIPNIDLYMDQVTTFMEKHLAQTRRYSDDKILTKTMINNYAKNDLLPPPEKKKYNKEHMMFLIFIYYLKNILTISDIDKLLSPLRENYFEHAGGTSSLEEVYETVFSEALSHLPQIRSDLERYAESAADSMKDLDPQNKDYLQLFSLISTLSFDVYLKKQIIERLIDRMPDPQDGKKKKKKQ